MTPPSNALEGLFPGVSNVTALSTQAQSIFNQILNSGANVSLTSAVWLKESDFPPTPPNHTALVESFYGNVSRVPNITADSVNTFISNGTRGKIDKIVEQRDVENQSSVLASALYFQDNWLKPFVDNDSVKLTIQGEAVEAMTLESDLQYLENNQYTAVRVPFRHGFDAYFVMLTNRTADKVSVKELSGFVPGQQQLQSAAVKLNVPRNMTFESKIDLLKLWSDLPRFRFLTGEFSFLDQRVNLTKATHVAMLKVNKDGAEGAAATVLVVGATSMPLDPPKPKEITFDKPFLFQIVHSNSTAVLFSSLYTRKGLTVNATAAGPGGGADGKAPGSGAASSHGQDLSLQWIATAVSLLFVLKRLN
ncbi:hypothetical protein HK102_006863 [Quaeritorhiza haematococci]|nr:hypothetical protein HK102_006863 [Quaeritorhiza haematococci]